jgi:nitrogen fixation NifU-like protein
MEQSTKRDEQQARGDSGPVLYYTDAVIDHFLHPRNVGELSDAESDGSSTIGDPGCGDEMRLWISVQKEKIEKIAFKSFGCPGAIATSSMLTVLAEGKSIQEASRITDDDVVNALGGIPENKKHCSLLGVRALHDAIEDYRKRRSIQ